MDSDSIIADLFKAGYRSARTSMYDDGIAWTIVSAGGQSVRVSVSWGDDAAKVIAQVLADRGLVVPASFTRQQPEWLRRASAKDLTQR